MDCVYQFCIETEVWRGHSFLAHGQSIRKLRSMNASLSYLTLKGPIMVNYMYVYMHVHKLPS